MSTGLKQTDKDFPWTKSKVNKSKLFNVSSPNVQKASGFKQITYKGRVGIINRNMHHEKILQSQIQGSALIPMDVYAMKNFDIIIYLGPFTHLRLKPLKRLTNEYPNTKLYIWWIGTDVYNAIHKLHGYNIEYVRKFPAVHLCVSEDLQRELKLLGIHAEIETLCPDVSELKILPLPEGYTVAVYMPDLQRNFYKYDIIKKIITDTPDIKYIIYGNKGQLWELVKMPNVDIRGWCDTKKVFQDSNCLLRLTTHDGFPKSIIEAICYGRYVVTNHNFPYTDLKNTIPEIINTIRKHPVIKPAVVDYYQNNYNFDGVKKRFN